MRCPDAAFLDVLSKGAVSKRAVSKGVVSKGAVLRGAVSKGPVFREAVSGGWAAEPAPGPRVRGVPLRSEGSATSLPYRCAMAPSTHRSSDEPRPILLSWSSGKDSAFALHVLRSDPRFEVRGLLTSVNATHERVAMHAVRRVLLREQARMVDLPLVEVEIPSPCTNADYELAMRAALEPQLAAGIEAVAFGDLFLEDVRRYREEKNAGLGLDSVFPLWGRDTAELAQLMLAAGQRAILTSVDPRQVPARFAGREFDAALLAELPAGADPCGENGEFHTFVWDAPVFTAPIAVEAGEVVERDGFVFADLVPRASGNDRAVNEASGPAAPAKL